MSAQASMKRYLLSIYRPAGELQDPERLRRIAADVESVREEMRAAGAWVLIGGLHEADTATVLRPGDDGIGMSDGPHVEGKEHIGGLVIIQARDLDEAFAWGRKVAQAAINAVHCDAPAAAATDWPDPRPLRPAAHVHADRDRRAQPRGGRCRGRRSRGGALPRRRPRGVGG